MCFNPSVGILFIQADRALDYPGAQWSFNPSVGILFIQADDQSDTPLVLERVSIPRSGFCSFKRGKMWAAIWRKWSFQSLGRDSVHSSRANAEQ